MPLASRTWPRMHQTASSPDGSQSLKSALANDDSPYGLRLALTIKHILGCISQVPVDAPSNFVNPPRHPNPLPPPKLASQSNVHSKVIVAAAYGLLCGKILAIQYP
jgi:hypothetical protein